MRALVLLPAALAMARIDVHHHYVPAFYRDELVANGFSHPDGMPAIPPWDVGATLDLMRTLNITKSILSISSPGTRVAADPARAAALSRRCNAFAADLKRQHPARFGFWASLPLPDVPAALAEIAAADAEGADGFALMTNAAGVYPGDALFDPVWAELDRRAATVFLHPATPCTRGAAADSCQPATPLAAVHPAPVFEFPIDTARAVLNLFASGVVTRYPAVTYVVPHAGGALPSLLTRFLRYSTANLSEDAVHHALATRFYFDLAGPIFGQATDANQLKSLLDGCRIGRDRLLYGSDFPFSPAALVQDLAHQLDEGLAATFSDSEVHTLLSRNAQVLLAGK